MMCLRVDRSMAAMGTSVNPLHCMVANIDKYIYRTKDVHGGLGCAVRVRFSAYCTAQPSVSLGHKPTVSPATR